MRDKNELIPSNRGDIHAEIIDWLRKSNDMERKRIGNALKRLRDDRNSADYDDILTGSPSSMAQQAIKMAKRIIKFTST
ncbi:MAG: hypothetical protein Q9P01_07840 [Anaerolineae bacterium]|nr:hypothetical protein [Anaerolineae bacterium]